MGLINIFNNIYEKFLIRFRMNAQAGGLDDPYVQKLMAQQELLAKMKKVSIVCWDKCMQDGVDSYLYSKQETCLKNCVDRYVDSLVLATNKFNQRMGGGQ